MAWATLPSGLTALLGDTGSSANFNEVGKGDARSLFVTTADGDARPGDLTMGMGIIWDD